MCPHIGGSVEGKQKKKKASVHASRLIEINLEAGMDGRVRSIPQIYRVFPIGPNFFPGADGDEDSFFITFPPSLRGQERVENLFPALFLALT